MPEEFTVTKRGEKFLLHDSGPEKDRMLVFGTPTSLGWLRSNTLAYDGTFKTSPEQFAQIFSVHALRNGTCMPCVIALLPNIKEDTYTRLFGVLKILQPQLNPTVLISDFERASLNAAFTEFPNARQHGCFFHFKQAMFRKVI